MSSPYTPSNPITLQPSNELVDLPDGETNTFPFAGTTATASAAYKRSYLVSSTCEWNQDEEKSNVVTLSNVFPHYHSILETTEDEQNTGGPTQLQAFRFNQTANVYQGTYQATSFGFDDMPDANDGANISAYNIALCIQNSSGAIQSFPSDLSVTEVSTIQYANLALKNLSFDATATGSGLSNFMSVSPGGAFFCTGSDGQGTPNTGILYYPGSTADTYDNAPTVLQTINFTTTNVVSYGSALDSGIMYMTQPATGTQSVTAYYMLNNATTPAGVTALTPPNATKGFIMGGGTRLKAVVNNDSENSGKLMIFSGATTITEQLSDIPWNDASEFLDFMILDNTTAWALHRENASAPYVYSFMPMAQEGAALQERWKAKIAYTCDTTKYTPVSFMNTTDTDVAMWSWSSYETTTADDTMALGIWRLENRNGTRPGIQWYFYPIYSGYATTSVNTRLFNCGFSNGYGAAQLPADSGTGNLALRMLNSSSVTNTVRQSSGYFPPSPDVTVVPLVEDSPVDVSPFRQYQINGDARDVVMVSGGGSFQSVYTGDDWKVTVTDDEKVVACSPLTADAATSQLDGVVNLEGLPLGVDTNVDATTYGSQRVTVGTAAVMTSTAGGVAISVPITQTDITGAVNGIQVTDLTTGVFTTVTGQVDSLTGAAFQVVAVAAMSTTKFILVVDTGGTRTAHGMTITGANAAATDLTPTPSVLASLTQSCVGTAIIADVVYAVLVGDDGANDVFIENFATAPSSGSLPGFVNTKPYGVYGSGTDCYLMWSGATDAYLSKLSAAGFPNVDVAGSTTLTGGYPITPQNSTQMGVAGDVAVVTNQNLHVYMFDTTATPPAWVEIVPTQNGTNQAQVTAISNFSVGPVANTYYASVTITPDGTAEDLGYCLVIPKTDATTFLQITDTTITQPVSGFGINSGYGVATAGTDIIILEAVQTNTISYRVGGSPPTPEPTGGPVPTKSGGGSGLKDWEKGVITVEVVLGVAGILALLLIFLVGL